MDQLTQTWNAFCNRMDDVRHEQRQLEGEVSAIARQCAAEVRRQMAKVEADAMTRELAQRSTRRVDAGREPIESSPLFGGSIQQSIFDDF